MYVWITLDMVDGSQSRVTKRAVSLDEIDLHGMLFKLNEKDVGAITFTRADLITKLMKEQADD